MAKKFVVDIDGKRSNIFRSEAAIYEHLRKLQATGTRGPVKVQVDEGDGHGFTLYENVTLTDKGIYN
jgi:hypothetical protein